MNKVKKAFVDKIYLLWSISCALCWVLGLILDNTTIFGFSFILFFGGGATLLVYGVLTDKKEDNINQTSQDIDKILKKGADASFKTTSLKEYLGMVSNIVKNKITNADIESLIANHRFKIVAFKHSKEKIETSIKIKFPNLSDNEISAIYEVISKD